MVVWFTGISGVGKTTLGFDFYKYLKTKHKNTIYFDGDQFRNIFQNDIKYTLKDRNISAIRLTRLVKFLSTQKIHIVISANLTSLKYRSWCKKNIKNYYEIYIKADMKKLLSRDYKKLYSRALKKKISNVVGVDIPLMTPRNSDIYINNNDSKRELFKYTRIIYNKLKKKNFIK